MEVSLLGSRTEEDLNDDGSAWPLVFQNVDGINNESGYMGFFTYKLTVGGLVSNSVPVFISVTPKNDQPTAFDRNIGAISDEDLAIEFNIPIGLDDKDQQQENLSYQIVSIDYYEVAGKKAPKGMVSHCANMSDSDGPSDTTCVFTPNGNYNGEVVIEYLVLDQFGVQSDTKSITFEISNVDDPPVLCQYDLFDESPECGLNHCIGVHPPSGRITPRSHTETNPVYYYQQGAAYCYRSTGTGIDDWEIDYSGYIGDIVVNATQEIVIDNIAIDEGGAK